MLRNGPASHSSDIHRALESNSAARSPLVASTRRIEAETFRQAFPNARILLVPGRDRMPDGIFVVDKDDPVIGASYTARSIDNCIRFAQTSQGSRWEAEFLSGRTT